MQPMFRRTVARGFTLLIKGLLVVLILVILVPVAYFAWRAGQQTDLPEFKVLTYYWFLDWPSGSSTGLIGQHSIPFHQLSGK